LRIQIFGQKSDSINNQKRLLCHPSAKIGKAESRACDLPVSAMTDISVVITELLPRLSVHSFLIDKEKAYDQKIHRPA
jgi:hypothetical protein